MRRWLAAVLRRWADRLDPAVGVSQSSSPVVAPDVAGRYKVVWYDHKRREDVKYHGADARKAVQAWEAIQANGLPGEGVFLDALLGQRGRVQR